MDALPALRDRLLALRDDALRQLAEADHLDAGMLRLIADAQVALAAIDDDGGDGTAAGQPRRGGDPAADRRRERDMALRELAPLIAGDLSVERQAHAVVERLSRYRPAPVEIGRDRQLMRTIAATGLATPGADRVARILRSGEQKRRLDTGRSAIAFRRDDDERR